MTAFDDLSLLRTFVCIVECGSISAGARRLKTPQPTLSRHLRLLEEHCGAALLRRDTHRMSLTQTGQRLLADAQTILAYAEAATQRLWEDQTTLSGHLRLFVPINTAILYAYSVWVGSGSRSSEASFLFTLKFDAEGNSKIVKSQQMSDKEVEKCNERTPN
jgi:molybdenum-dependent DNA-binding transcriptional regulator ModE